MDQAKTLRQLMTTHDVLQTAPTKPVRVIAVTSGKGGVGKSNIVANLAYLLQSSGLKTLVLDGDFGLANLNILMGKDSPRNLFDVLSGEAEVTDVLIKGPAGLHLIPSSSGIFEMTNLSISERAILTDALENLPYQYDVLLIDTGAGIHSDVLYLNAAASEVIVVATSEPTSIADAYALMKVMSQNYRVKKFKLLVNRVESAQVALGVYNHILNVSDRFLNIHIEYLGHIPEDKTVSQAVMSRKILCEGWSNAKAAKAMNLVAKTLITSAQNTSITGNVQFFWRSLLSEVNA